MMFVKMFFLFAFSHIAVPTIAQKNLLDNYLKNPNYEVKMLADSTIEIYDKPNNFRWKKNIAEYPKYKSNAGANLTIRLDTIDFSLYDDYYRNWGSIPAENSYGKYIAVDANKNGKQEIYAYSAQPDSNWFYYQQRIYEQIVDSVFNKIYEYPELSGSFVDVGDITGDGLIDLIDGKINCYSQIKSTDLLINLSFLYKPFPTNTQFNTPTFYDIDSDGILEIIYYLDAGYDSIWSYSNHVAKYNPQINNYELVYYHRPYPDFYTYGISIGDFDQDGKENFGTGSIDGKFYIYEYVQGNQYKVEFQDTLPTSNAFFTAFTEDMDGNGKPEVWVGGDYAGMTRLFAYEASPSWIYHQIYQIDIIGLSALFYGKLKYVDLDYDGQKELYLQNANVFFGFKYDGNGNYYMDFVSFIPLPDSTYTYRSLNGVDVADFDGDGVVEIITQYSQTNGYPQPFEFRSYFQKRNKLTDIRNENIIVPSEFNLFQNYPNPFNPNTNVKFTLPSESKISIKIYNTLGKEIKELINETRSSGEYEIAWDGTDNFGNKVSSGVYFITMEANSITKISLPFRKTIKSIFLK